jgi:hypothetical protein
VPCCLQSMSCYHSLELRVGMCQVPSRSEQWSVLTSDSMCVVI